MHIPTLLDGVEEGKLCLLVKSLYSLREAPLIWYNLLSKLLKTIGLNPMDSAPCVFRKKQVIVLIYVDDLLIITETEDILVQVKSQLLGTLPSKDLGLATDFLGIKLVHGKGYVQLVQSKYTEGLVRDVRLSDSVSSQVPCDPSVDLSIRSEEAAENDFQYRSIIGSLMYLATHTRPDISVATSMLARHVESPSMKHQRAAMKVLKYLKGKPSLGLTLRPGTSNQLSCYVDSNWGGEKGTGRRSRSGIVLLYGNAAI